MRVMLAALAVLVLACGSSDPHGSTGDVTLSIRYVQPSPGQPVSIGGYATFGVLTSVDGRTIFSGELDPINPVADPAPTPPRLQPPAGQYRLDVSVREASDAIGIDQNGNIHRDFGSVTSTCTAAIAVTASSLTAVTVTLVGGTSCSISATQ